MGKAASAADPGSRSYNRRLRLLAIILATGSLGTIGGWVGSRFIESPNEVAARTEPPPPTTLTASVVQQRVRVLASGSGTIKFDNEHQLRVPEGEAPVNSRPVVTRLHLPKGKTVASGTVVAEVAGRPLIALSGHFPLYRDIRLGDRGPDVAQLRDSLSRLGWVTVDPPSVFGPSSAKALRGFYTRRGYEPPSDGAKVYVSSYELIFDATLPARLQSYKVAVGSQVTGPVAMLSSGTRIVKARVPINQVDGLEVGLNVKGTGSGGTAFTGVVRSVGEPSPSEEAGFSLPVTVEVRGGRKVPRPSDSVAIQIMLASSPRDSLTVPLAAVFSDDRGGYLVKKVNGDTVTEIPVELGLDDGARVVIKPTGSETAIPDDQVVVGQR